jgi:hypothetical protein
MQARALLLLRGLTTVNMGGGLGVESSRVASTKFRSYSRYIYFFYFLGSGFGVVPKRKPAD